MRLAKIKNKYMYKTIPEDNGTHYYLLFYNQREKRYNALQLTHLYTKDETRFKQLKRGFIKKEKFKEFDVPSGVWRKVYKTNFFGSNIDIKNKNNIELFKRILSKKQSDRIKKFLKI